MKKIKFFIIGLFSLFFFGYSFSEVLFLPGKSINNVITFEQPGTNNNITYLTTSYSGYQYSRLSYIGSLGTKIYPEYYYVSDYENGGSTLNLDFTQDIFFNHQLQQIGLSTKSQREGYGLLTLSWNTGLNTYYPDFVKYYHQVADSNTYNNNYIVSFDENYNTLDTFRYLSNVYARFFYSPSANSNNLFWKQNQPTPAYADHNGVNPIDYQLFTTNGFYSRLGHYSFPSSKFVINITPGLGYGFGYNTYSYNVFGTVFPYYDHGLESSDFVNGEYTLPSWAYTEEFMMFRVDGGNLNSNNSNIGVLKKCDNNTCSSLGTHYLSKYSCLTPGNGLSIDPSTHYINIKESCTFITGGVVDLSMHNSDFGLSDSNSSLYVCTSPACVFSLGTYDSTSNSSCIGSFFSASNSLFSTRLFPTQYSASNFLGSNPFLNLSITSSSLYAKFTTAHFDEYSYACATQYSCFDEVNSDCVSDYDYYSFKLSDINYSYYQDMLSTFNNATPPSNPNSGLNYGSTTTGDSILQQLCSQSMYKNALFCKGYNGTVVYLSGSNQPYQISTTTSGGRIFTTISDYSETIEYYYYTGEDGSLNIECVGDWCPIINNDGYILGETPSGFMLGTGYYSSFLNKTGFWGKCPYPYSNINFGYQQGVLARINNLIGDFDIFLPINCGIAAFIAGSNYNFFDSFIPEISSPLISRTDSSNGLLNFFDFLFSIAIFFFLFKLYNLLKH